MAVSQTMLHTAPDHLNATTTPERRTWTASVSPMRSPGSSLGSPVLGLPGSPGVKSPNKYDLKEILRAALAKEEEEMVEMSNRFVDGRRTTTMESRDNPNHGTNPNPTWKEIYDGK